MLLLLSLQYARQEYGPIVAIRMLQATYKGLTYYEAKAITDRLPTPKVSDVFSILTLFV